MCVCVCLTLLPRSGWPSLRIRALNCTLEARRADILRQKDMHACITPYKTEQTEFDLRSVCIVSSKIGRRRRGGHGA